MTPRKIIKRLGGPSEVARIFGITRQATSQWLAKNKIPAKRLDWMKVERPEVFRES